MKLIPTSVLLLAAFAAAFSDEPTGAKLPVISLPVRVHLVQSETMPDMHTTLTEADVRRIFGKVNAVWAQAGIHFEIESIGPTQAIALKPELQDQSEFVQVKAKIPKERLSPTAIDICYVKKVRPNGFYYGEPIVVKDTASLKEVPGGLDEPLPRVTSHEIGHALGLKHRQETTNLMASGTTGFSLNESEIATARTKAQERLDKGESPGSEPQSTGAPAAALRPSEIGMKSQKDIYHEGWIDFNKNGKKDVFEDPTQPQEKRVEDLLSQMNVDEKTCQLATLYGYRRVLKDPLPTPKWKEEIWKDGIANIDEMHNGVGKSGDADNPHIATPAATVRALNEVQRWFIEETRLGIPVEYTNEGIRGANYRKSVNFPANISLGATWNRELVTRVGEVVAREEKAIGYRNVYAPLLDLARDPRWGRVVECYGEDPYHVAELGLCMARAIRSAGLVNTCKHFAVYSEPKGGRDGNARTDPHVAPREMEMLHLRPWERMVRETGLLGVMSSYNDYDGVPISGSTDFLIDRLRKQWGFKGYVVSDSEAVEYLFTKHHVASSADDAAAMFLRSGGNVRTHFKTPDTFILPVRREIAAGRLSMDVVDARVRDVLRVKFIEGLFDSPYIDPEAAGKEIGAPESKQLALRAARESLVLLKNDKHTLPLGKSLKRVLVCGPTATMIETSYDRYGSNGGAVISPLEGIQTFLKGTGTEVVFAQGCEVTDKHWPESELFPEPPSGDEATQIADAAEKAKSADAVIVFVGDSDATIGESKSRTSLDLVGQQNDLVRALVKTGKPVIAVLLIGKPASINFIQRNVPAVLNAGIPGESGGTAIAEALFGDYNPGGRLPVTFPKTVGQLPFNFPFKPASHASQSKKVDPNGFGNSMAEGALYPFGFGLSYTTFEYGGLKVSPAQIPTTGEVTVTCEIKNSGDRAGDEVAQLYFRQETASVTTYELNLCGFERVHLAPGETKTVSYKLPASALELINREGKRVVEPGTFKLTVGSSSTDPRLTGGFEVSPSPK